MATGGIQRIPCRKNLFVKHPSASGSGQGNTSSKSVARLPSVTPSTASGSGGLLGSKPPQTRNASYSGRERAKSRLANNGNNSSDSYTVSRSGIPGKGRNPVKV